MFHLVVGVPPKAAIATFAVGSYRGSRSLPSSASLRTFPSVGPFGTSRSPQAKGQCVGPFFYSAFFILRFFISQCPCPRRPLSRLPDRVRRYNFPFAIAESTMGLVLLHVSIFRSLTDFLFRPNSFFLPTFLGKAVRSSAADALLTAPTPPNSPESAPAHCRPPAYPPPALLAAPCQTNRQWPPPAPGRVPGADLRRNAP